MISHILLSSLAEQTGKSEAYLRKVVRTESLGFKVPWGTREVWAVSSATADLLRSRFLSPTKPSRSPSDFDRMVEEWANELSSGYLTGRSLTETTVKGYRQGLKRYFAECELPPSVQSVHPENYRRIVAKLKVDDQLRKCNFARKRLIYDALMSFYTYLIDRGLKSPAEKEALKKYRPKRQYDERQTVLNDGAEIKRLLAANLCSGNRTAFDVALNDVVIYLGVLMGLRRQEMIDLQVDCIDFASNVVTVYGKGRKVRRLGMSDQVRRCLRDWIKKWRCAVVGNRPGALIVQANGEPATPSMLQQRMARLRQAAGIDITLHGLRRTFITQMNRKGMELTLLQKLSGHSDIKTLMKYVKRQEAEAIKQSQELATLEL